MDNTTSMDHVEFTDRRSLPMMALRGLTVFPGMMLTFEVERSMSIAALNMAMSDDQIIYLVPQIDIATDIPTPEDVYGVGTVCRIKQMMKQPGSKTVRVMAEGIERGRTLAVRTDMPCFVAEVEPMPDVAERKTARIEALIRHCCNLFDAYVTVSGNMAPESVITVLGSTNAGFVSNFIAQHVFLRPEQKQELLEQTRPSRRLTLLSKMLLHETSVLGLQHQLEEAAQDRLNQTQQEYLLREQMKIIQAELGEADDPDSESTAYREKIQALHLPEESEQRLLKEVDRLKKQPFGSSEASVIRNYLDICLEMPWNTRTEERLDVRAARKVLDDEHFGLEKVKDRITEYLAVRQLAPDVKGGVLCLVGPPGTGKTSIAMSIAHATNRKLSRISLGGVHDEAEIRGHRKTYVGAMPGRIINGLTIAGSMNPVMVLDEIDKLGSDYRGDPSSALLEVLDAEQNATFRDNFLEIPFDLSECMFITTANTADTIPRALLDRMEVISLGSYTDEEKLQIARRAVELIEEGSTIFLGTGTTVEQMASMLPAFRLRIVTNSLSVFNLLEAREDCDLCLVGGMYRRRTAAFVGPMAEDTLRALGIDAAYIGANGILDGDVSTSNMDEGRIQQLAFSKADSRYLIADSSKIGKRDFYTFCRLDSLDAVVCEPGIADGDRAAIEEHTQVIC